MSKYSKPPSSKKAPSYANDDISDYMSKAGGGDRLRRNTEPNYQKKVVESDNVSNYFAAVAKKKPSVAAPTKETVIDSTGM
jgi:hypothetical protein